MSNKRKSAGGIPASEKVFITFALLFVAVVVIVIAGGSRLDSSQQPPAEKSSAAAPSEIVSADESSLAEETSAKGEEESSLPEESSDAPVELPYDPAKLLDLRKEDITQSGLDDYFKNSVFIGNSLVVHFSNFYYIQRASVSGFLGGAEFFCSSAFSARLELNNSMTYNPRYNGEQMHTWDAVRDMGATTVYYNLMGLNELGLHATDTCAEETFENNRILLEKIIEQSPNVKIVVLSNTYMVESFNSDKRLNNEKISQLNNLALDWCNVNGWDFIDIASPFLVGDVLGDEYCRDAYQGGCGCHIKDMYYPAWAAMLRNYAYQKLNGTWKNPDTMRTLSKS